VINHPRDSRALRASRGRRPSPPARRALAPHGAATEEQTRDDRRRPATRKRRRGPPRRAISRLSCGGEEPPMRFPCAAPAGARARAPIAVAAAPRRRSRKSARARPGTLCIGVRRGLGGFEGDRGGVWQRARARPTHRVRSSTTPSTSSRAAQRNRSRPRSAGLGELTGRTAPAISRPRFDRSSNFSWWAASPDPVAPHHGIA
jgi:hypothetical protein